ncbi:putative S-adenosyl-L-methionine-dependent methyltransferase [Mycobacterium mantenii]|uniref:S-adenosyl-L-methionine-dependent methyltransferase n=1 Tax=Mycobacterium mantenii TaxID=560555 RepID=A0ABN6A943_MYCNT|nr:putative S-adenosyl-L-methionine-dependent methyltransferase [Mycobacterium mantenii]
MVAVQRALAHREKLIDDPYAESLVREVGQDFFIRLIDSNSEMQEANPEFRAWCAADGMAARTRFFDRFFADAAASGVRQAVILAAGLDARSYRLPWPDGMVVFEVDQPEVIDFRTRSLARLGAHPAVDHRPIGIDLRDDWPKALTDNAFDPIKPTAWIAEGLLIYLPPDAQDRLFESITRLSAPGSRMATEYVPDMSLLFSERAKRIAEPAREYGHGLDVADLVYHGERGCVIEDLGRLGWLVSSQTTKELYEANGFAFPDDEATAPFGNANYVRAVLPKD